jgi:hypothetical protein
MKRLRELNWNRALSGGAPPLGEMGELCNLLKKRLRGADQITKQQLMEEIGGTIIYLDLLAAHLELPTLDIIVRYEFNRVSAKRKLPFFIEHGEENGN